MASLRASCHALGGRFEGSLWFHMRISALSCECLAFSLMKS
ncbi:hypothetical protein SynNOUM97013_00832 [Synechococcus sp. NOUM97013]|nr:hypothetical protein SynNOUM97013_00832 [Synechococcus sp. NOUM97013]